MNQSELFYREASSGSGSSAQESPIHNVIDKRRHHCKIDTINNIIVLVEDVSRILLQVEDVENLFAIDVL